MYNGIMAKRLTPEEKVQRDLDKKAKREAERLAKIAARRAAFDAQRLAEKTAFEAGLSPKEKAAIASILVPTGQEQDPYQPAGVLRNVFENEFIESLFRQLTYRGSLSTAQLAVVVRQYDRKIEVEALVSNWPSIVEGDEVMVLCEVLAVEVRPNTGFGSSFKIKLKSHYGRIFHVNTNALRFLDVARQALNEKSRVNVQGKAGWVSPDSRVVVLDKKGLYFKPL